MSGKYVTHFLRRQRKSAAANELTTLSYDADVLVKQALNRAMTLELSVDKTAELILAFLRQQDWLRSPTERGWFKSPSLNTEVR